MMRETIKFKLGGINNSLELADITLNLDSSSKYFEPILSIVGKIDNIYIDPANIDTRDVRELLAELRALLASPAIKTQREYVKTIIQGYFEEVIRRMPFEPVKLGDPNWLSYYYQWNKIKEITGIVNEALFALGVINKKFALNLTIPELVNSNALKDLAVGQLPKTLWDFVASIETSYLCAPHCYEWFMIFESCSATPDVLRAYFQQIIIEIQHKAKMENVSSISRKIEDFLYEFEPYLGHLANQRRYHFIRGLFLDVAAQVNSIPEHSDEEQHVLSLEQSQKQAKAYTNKLLKKSLELLIQDHSHSHNHSHGRNRNFDRSFAAFRQELSAHLKLPHVKSNELFPVLKKHFNTKSKGSDHSSRVLKKYLNRCIKRIEQPLPNHLNNRIDRLIGLYSEHAPGARENKKFIFLSALKDNIQIHPEKTYHECFELTAANVDPDIQALLREPKGFRFFEKHQFKDFIDALLGYEEQYLSAASNLESFTI